MLDRLNQLFKGKVILITSVNPEGTKEGVCKTVTAWPDHVNGFDVVMTDGSKFGFSVDEITDTSAEQKDFRKIEIVQKPCDEAFSSKSYLLSFPPKVLSPTTTNNILFDSTDDIERYFSQLKVMGIVSYYQLSGLKADGEISVVYHLSRQKDQMFEVPIKMAVKFLSFSPCNR